MTGATMMVGRRRRSMGPLPPLRGMRSARTSSAHRRQELDAVLLHRLHDLVERCTLSNRHHIGRHDLGNLAAMSVDVLVAGSEPSETRASGTVSVRSRFPRGAENLL